MLRRMVINMHTFAHEGGTIKLNIQLDVNLKNSDILNRILKTIIQKFASHFKKTF